MSLARTQHLARSRQGAKLTWHLKLQPSQRTSEHFAKQFGEKQMVREDWMQTLEEILAGLLKSPSTKQEA